MTAHVNLRASTVGEFDLRISVWLINPEDPDDEVDCINEFEGNDALHQAEIWCSQNDYEIVERPFKD